MSSKKRRIKKPKRRNEEAEALESPLFRQRIVPNKKKRSKYEKSKRPKWDDE